MIMMPSLDAYAEKIKGIFDLTADMSYATQLKKNQVPNMNRKGLHNNTPPQKKCCTQTQIHYAKPFWVVPSMFSIPSVSLMLGILFSLGRAASHLPCPFLFTFPWELRLLRFRSRSNPMRQIGVRVCWFIPECTPIRWLECPPTISHTPSVQRSCLLLMVGISVAVECDCAWTARSGTLRTSVVAGVTSIRCRAWVSFLHCDAPQLSWSYVTYNMSYGS